ncbi:glycoside hydrolase family 61 protein G [Mycena floridula]|nr:glycoside hydrolase family 61 protein G [Mycena floridula]
MFPISALILLASTVSARTVFSALSINGVDQGHGVGVRVPSSNAPITDLTSPNLICNTGFIQPVSQTVLQVPAGAQVTAQFHHTSAGAPATKDPSDPTDPTDKGPILAYLAAIPSALQTNVTGLQWFKIFQEGYNPATNQWASDLLFIAKGNVTFTIPACLATGDYLLRVEDIGLEFATSYPGAEFYMSCAQIHITGPSAATTVKPATTSIPGIYKSTDPGLVLSVYTVDSYTLPGPSVFTCPA